jgi:hypothetical protein
MKGTGVVIDVGSGKTSSLGGGLGGSGKLAGTDSITGDSGLTSSSTRGSVLGVSGPSVQGFPTGKTSPGCGGLLEFWGMFLFLLIGVWFIQRVLFLLTNWLIVGMDWSLILSSLMILGRGLGRPRLRRMCPSLRLRLR